MPCHAPRSYRAPCTGPAHAQATRRRTGAQAHAQRGQATPNPSPPNLDSILLQIILNQGLRSSLMSVTVAPCVTNRHRSRCHCYRTVRSRGAGPCGRSDLGSYRQVDGGPDVLRSPAGGAFGPSRCRELAGCFHGWPALVRQPVSSVAAAAHPRATTDAAGRRAPTRLRANTIRALPTHIDQRLSPA